MGHVVNRFHVDAPPERVFELSIQAERFPEWVNTLVEVKDVSAPLDRVGASYTGVMKIAGRRLEGRWEVTRVEKPRYLETTGTAPGGGRATTITRLEPAGGGTDSTFELDYELPGGFLGGAVDKLFVERAMERDVIHSGENLKAICEAEVLAHA